MKNNRLTNHEIYQIRVAMKSIKALACMENCAFRDEKQVDIYRLKLWLMWFEVEANKINEILDSEQMNKV